MFDKRNIYIICICIICIFSMPLEARAETQPQTQIQIQINSPNSSETNSSQSQDNTVIQNQNDNTEKTLQQYIAQEQGLNNDFNTQTEQELTLDVKILSLQQSLQTINDGIASDQASLEAQQTQLKDLQTKQTQLQKQRQEDSDKLGDILNTFYQSGNEQGGFLPFMEVLFDSTSMSDFLDRWEYISYVVNDYQHLNHAISISNTSITKQQTQINAKMASVKSSIQEKEKLQQTQQQLLATQQNLLGQVNSQEKATILSSFKVQSNIEQLTQEQSLESSLVEAGREAGINPTESGVLSTKIKQLVPVSANFQSILAYAEQYLGTPYVWGGTSPAPGFDCSGFVQYVYGNFGVKLNRVSEDQYQEGIGIPESDLKPGDLVFFSTYESGASHVGIYIGNNIMIDSEAYGVCFDNITNSYWSARYLGARRVVFFANE
ncbi:cell wall-associated hydrolase, invasion-associated protein [Desulfosporosinus acidiphilus SJ4]|uniref:Cell wall-associated hydrolase, invasion-associated protein n=1 Tax=Desulfosporosinus acidiphilus (strain DSM 22704 / JCM 16185 / SJ4) TaxID=646529 RepID=I4D7E8_DESAJ|nr:C40 family peptidase [Desulfosporosinus acidiphilus]AFM41722.1 cell wall-associated hydrolase, invasion-associated protein [Desulfosporosinus acidiphilus SJ4]